MYLNATKVLCFGFDGDGSKIVELPVLIDAVFSLHWAGKSYTHPPQLEGNLLGHLQPNNGQ